MNNRGKKLFSDVTMFAISNFGSKVLVFLLVPLYTNTLSTAEYGIADLFSISINLLLPLLTLSITEATIRFMLDEESDKGKVLGTSLLIIGISFAILFFLRNIIVLQFPVLKPYYWMFLLTYIMNALNSCFSNFVRGLDYTRVFAIKGIIYTVSVIFCNIVFLLVLKIGLWGYLLSVVLAELITIMYMLFAGNILKYFKELHIEKRITVDMIRYSIPMMPTIIAWWIMQMSDKYIIIAVSGLAVSGIYSIAYKIPSILSIVSTIFNQAWQISAIKSRNDDDYSLFFKNVYNIFLILSGIACGILVMGAKFLGGILFAKDYYVAWKYVPFLLIAYFFSGLSGVMASAFTSNKKTSILFYSTLAGAIVNIGLNILLIPKYGAIAAAITTMIGFIVNCLIRDICMKRYFNMRMNGIKEFVVFFLLLVEAILFTIELYVGVVVFIILILALILLYYREIMGIINMFRKILRKLTGRVSNN
ncbi:MAG: exopolysaccharide biosynthesis protein [Lachnospiraceae bacterium]|nr:exopolysaccharide biosynthesis protein [Lachnospiraceae bacterium]